MQDVQYRNTFTTEFTIRESTPDRERLQRILDDPTFWEHCAECVDILVQAELIKWMRLEN